MRGLKSLFSRLFRLFSNLGQSSLLCTCIAYEAGTHLTGNDIIQKYCMKHDPTFIHFIGRCTESQSTWCELKITWAVENFCPAPVKREKLLNKYFSLCHISYNSWLQPMKLSTTSIYLTLGLFFFFLFKLYKAFHLQSVFRENTPASPPYTISLFIMRVPPALAREIKKH